MFISCQMGSSENGPSIVGKYIFLLFREMRKHSENV